VSLNPPWNTAIERNGDVTVASMDGGAVVAVIRKADVPRDKTRQDLAHLFAAAPDLYDVAEALVEEHDKRENRRTRGAHRQCLCRQCVRLIHVLEKARGEKPHAPKLEIS
jgi:hypothetical protein